MISEPSPDVFRPDAGVRRLNRRPLAIIAVTLATVVLAVACGMASKSRRLQSPTMKAERRLMQPAESAARELAKNVPKSGPIPEAPTTERFRGAQEAGLIAAADEKLTPLNVEVNTDELERHRRLASRREQMEQTALTAVTRVATVDELLNRSPRERGRETRGAAPESTAAVAAVRAMRSSQAGTRSPDDDINRQAQKNAFAEQQRTVGYLPATRQAPLSRFELKTGTVIPAVLISGVNSDLPGQLLAQVTENVYDTATGRFLLVPQGAKLVGVYDSRISVGQSRVQIAWTRLNFPDASTLDLGNMPGVDQAGYSGLGDRVNSHSFRIFRDAIMLSMLSAGAQISQPRARGEGQITAEQQMAAALGQQFAATGAEITKRNIQVQPTLEVRPGFRFNVMVTRDVVLAPYSPETAVLH